MKLEFKCENCNANVGNIIEVSEEVGEAMLFASELPSSTICKCGNNIVVAYEIEE